MRIASAEVCPAQIHGGWEADIQIAGLAEILIEIGRGPGGDYSARLSSSDFEEAVAVWHDKRRLRLQSERFGLSVEGRLSPSEERIEGFVVAASNLHRVTLGAGGADRWSTTWRRLPHVAESAKLDMYLDDDGSGGTAAYFFFRDDRLPSLYGLGATCVGQSIEAREKNLGLTFSGGFDSEYSKLTMTVTGPGADSEVTFTRMSPDRLNMSPGSNDRPPRTRNDPGFTGAAPQDLDDGWQSARPHDLGLDIEPLSAMVESITKGDMPNTHSILVAKNGYLVVEEYFSRTGRSLRWMPQ